MKPLLKNAVNPDEDGAITLPELGDKPVGLARFFSRNAPWLNLRRKINTEPVPKTDESAENVGSK
jgi:hypothetical protein